MRRLIAVTIALCISFATLTGVVVAIGRRVPIEDSLAALHLTDCAAPCWMGIEPGKTTLREASARVHAVYGASPSYTIQYDTSLSGRLRITLSSLTDPTLRAQITLDTHELSDDLPVLTITLNFAAVSSYPFTLAELVSQLGDPQHVYLIGGVG